MRNFPKYLGINLVCRQDLRLVCSQVSPNHRQAVNLKEAVDDRLVKDGLIGVGIVGTGVMIAGVVAAVLSSRR